MRGWAWAYLPVEFLDRTPSHPPIMPGWHDYPIPSAFGRYECPVYVDNDVNVMALGEMGSPAPSRTLVVKVGTGIGCGVIVDGRVYRGAQGSAGDIGHIYVAQPDGRTVVCRCENCLEAIAGGGALLRDAVAAGLPVSTTRGRSWPRGRRPAIELVRSAGRTIGTVLAALVNFFNPHRIVMTGSGGMGAPCSQVSEAVYGRSMPLAARTLEITVSDAPDLSGRRRVDGDRGVPGRGLGPDPRALRHAWRAGRGGPARGDWHRRAEVPGRARAGVTPRFSRHRGTAPGCGAVPEAARAIAFR